MSYPATSLGVEYCCSDPPYQDKDKCHEIIWGERKKTCSQACQNWSGYYIDRFCSLVGEISEQGLSYHINEIGDRIQKPGLCKGYTQPFNYAGNKCRKKGKMEIIYKMPQA